MALKQGDSLQKGRYRIRGLLGQGGFGFVYEAQEKGSGRPVAIKELIPALVNNKVMLKRFLAEAKATSQLNHHHIVGTHRIFSEDGNHYIVMEYMAGGSLEQWLQASTRLALNDAQRIAVEVCAGLGYAHEQGIVHCDLKPANILFEAGRDSGRWGSAKVADFGIAHISDKVVSRTWMTATGFVAGTLPYMSPEQTEGVRDDPRVDLYGLGAVLYRMLTGTTYLVFDEGETPLAHADNVYRIRTEPPLPPSQHAEEVPDWLDGVVLKALSKNPETRYPSADAFRAALARRRPVTIVTARPKMAGSVAVPEPSRPTPVLSLDQILAPPTPPPRPPGTSPRSLPGKPWRSVPAWLWLVLGAVAALLLPLALVLLVNLSLGDGQPPVPPVAAQTEIEPSGSVSPQIAVLEAPGESTVASVPADPPGRASGGLVLVSVPAGDFLMGSADTDVNAREEEKPQHSVHLDGYWLGQTEVTNAQYRQCVEAGACPPPGCWDDAGLSEPDQPVVCVSWDDAQAYAVWVGGRLPTEAEWEKAARGTDGRRYPWGHAFDGRFLNYCDNNCDREYRDASVDDGYARTGPAGVYPAAASPYGMLDLAGNASEWVADWYGPDYYRGSPIDNPLGPEQGQRRALRGGGFGDSAEAVRSAARASAPSDQRAEDVGFRVAFSIVALPLPTAPTQAPTSDTPPPTATPTPTPMERRRPTSTPRPFRPTSTSRPVNPARPTRTRVPVSGPSPTHPPAATATLQPTSAPTTRPAATSTLPPTSQSPTQPAPTSPPASPPAATNAPPPTQPAPTQPAPTSPPPTRQEPPTNPPPTQPPTQPAPTQPPPTKAPPTKVPPTKPAPTREPPLTNTPSPP